METSNVSSEHFLYDYPILQSFLEMLIDAEEHGILRQ